MSLSYQPFAESQEIDTLRRDLQMNVPDSERFLGGIAGIALVGVGMGFRGVTRWSLFGLAAAMIARAMTGKCALYRRMNLDRRHVRARKAPSDEDVASLARRFWEEEGSPEGRAEEHWKRAQEELGR
jgi:hypothetical protein